MFVTTGRSGGWVGVRICNDKLRRRQKVSVDSQPPLFMPAQGIAVRGIMCATDGAPP